MSNFRRRSLGLLIVFGLLVIGAGVPVIAWSADENQDWEEGALSDLEAAASDAGAIGMYRDHKSGEIVLVVPQSSLSNFSAFDAPRLRVRVEFRAIDQTDIDNIGAELRGMLEQGLFDGHGLESWFDARSGTVVVGTTARAAFDRVERQFPDKVTLHFGSPQLLSRQWDVEPHYGGTTIYSGSNDYGPCTAGFSILNVNGYDRMLTAGHCSQNVGQEVHPVQGDSFGTVKQRDDYPDNDFELVGSNSIAQAPRIYTSTSPSGEANKKVLNAWQPSLATPQYCWSGQTTYVNCDNEFVTLSAPNYCPTVPGGGWAYPGDHCNNSTAIMCNDDGFPPFGGDSGSPVYKQYTGAQSDYVGIRGIVIGTDSFDVCAVVEVWNQFTNAYSLTIKTAP